MAFRLPYFKHSHQPLGDQNLDKGGMIISGCPMKGCVTMLVDSSHICAMGSQNLYNSGMSIEGRPV